MANKQGKERARAATSATVRPPRTLRLEIDTTDRRPTPKQEKFLRDRTPFRLLCGGIGSGKSSTGVEAFLQGILENPGCDAMMVAPTLALFERFMRPEWERACPPGLIAGHNAGKKLYRLITGQRVFYGSSHVARSLHGTNIAVFWADELSFWPRASWEAMAGRLRQQRARRPQAIATSTPAFGWMEQQFNRKRDFHSLHPISTEENAINLSPDFLARMKSVLPRTARRVYLDGEFLPPQGQVYEQFDPATHLIGWEPTDRYRTSVFVDFGYHHASALFAQHIDDAAHYVGGRRLPPLATIIFDEVHPENQTTETLAALIQAKLKQHRLEPYAFFVDPAGAAKTSKSHQTDVSILRDMFGRKIYYSMAKDATSIPSGVLVVQAALAPIEGDPMLYFDHRLAEPREEQPPNDFYRGIIPTLRGYRYPEARNGNIVSDHPEKDGYLDHCADALRYGMIGWKALTNQEPPPGPVEARYFW
jgi:hypothetical protein